MFDKDNKFGFIINNNENNLEINKPYIESQLTNLKAIINDDGLIDTDGFDRTSNSTSKNIGNIVYKNFEDDDFYNNIIDITNKIHITIKNNEIIVFDNIFDISESRTCFNARYYLTLPEGVTGTYYFNVSIIKNKKYTTEGIIDYKGGVTISISYLHAPEITDFMKGNMEIDLKLVKRNPKNISSIYQFQEVPNAKYSIAPYGNDYSNLYVGDCSVNFGAGDIPGHSYISGSYNDFCRSLGEGYPACSSYLGIFGGTNTFKMINYGLIGGYKNIINADYRGSGMYGVLCTGANNTFEEQHGNRDGYLGIIGQGIKCYKSGVYLGAYGDVPPTEIFAVCNGSQSQDKVLFSINRDTGVVTSCGVPTKDEHLVTKKYVDDSGYINEIKLLPVEYDNGKIVNVKNLEAHSTYICPNDVDLLDLEYEKDSKLIAFLITPNKEQLIYVGNKTDKQIELMVGVNSYVIHFKTETQAGSMEKNVYYLTPNNNMAFTPTKDYNPVHKKYVDDKVSSLPQFSFNETGELVVTINGVSKTFVPKSE